MRTSQRSAAAFATTTLVIALAAGCSNDSGSVDDALWRQLDAAENVIYGVLTDPTQDVPTPDSLLERLSEVVYQWDGQEEPSDFAEHEGTAVVYNDRADDADATFDVFVASGRDERSTSGWFGSTPNRVYTCYRIEVTFSAGALSDFRRTHDYGEDRLVCPPELISALGSGAQYREPSVFDG